MKRPDERGMALLTVLLLVAVMSALAVSVLDDIRFALRRTANAEAVGQARWYAMGAETLVSVQIRRLIDQDATSSGQDRWNGRVFRIPVEDGVIQARLSAGADCFNLNSVVRGQGDILVARDLGERQFKALLIALRLGSGEADALAAALTDWIDADQIRESGGAEDEAYARGDHPYRTAGTLIAEVSELRAIRGFTPDVYSRLRPYVCALPTAALSPINVNTLTPDQAVLITMLTDGQVSIDAAKRVVAARPAGGWADKGAFWDAKGLGPEALPADEAAAQITLRPAFLVLDTEVAYRGAEVVSSALFDNDPAAPPRLAARRWTRDE